MRPAFPSPRRYSNGIGVLQPRQIPPRRLTVPSIPEDSPNFTENCTQSAFGPMVGFSHALFPAFLDNQNDLASGTSKRHAGLGHLTVRAHSHAIHRQLLAHILLQIRPVLGHLLRDLHLWIEMADAFLRLVAHPLAVVADVLGQALGAGPGF